MIFFKKVREIRSRKGDLHFRRYAIIECKWFGIYIHRIYKSIADVHMHDHPWNFLTVVLWGGYIETTEDGIFFRSPGEAIFHKAELPHNVHLRLDDKHNDVVSTTLVFTGRRFREWGYHTEEGWMNLEDYKKRFRTPINDMEQMNGQPSENNS